MKSIGIIGAGVTGLVAAWKLRRAGVPVTLYEASGRAGGVIQSIRRDGFLAESGPNTILETSPLIPRLIEDLGLSGRRTRPGPLAANRYVVRNGRPAALPASVFKFLGSSLLSPAAKLRMCAEPFIARAAREESIGEFVVRRLGREFLDYLIDPLVGGIYAGDPARLSVRHAFPKIHGLEERHGSLIRGQIFGAAGRRKRKEVSKATAPKFSFDEGLQVLIDALASGLGSSLRLSARVLRARNDGRGWTLTLRSSRGTEDAEHSALLYAGTAHQLAALDVVAGEPVDMSIFSEIDHAPVASVVLGFNRDDVGHPLDGFGVLIPAIEKFRILGTIFSSSLFENRAPAGKVLLTTYLGGARDREIADQSPETLTATAMRELRRLLDVRGEPVFRHVTIFKRAMPQYNVGYGRFKERMDGIERGCPGFFLAGHFRHGVSLSDSILSGMNAAERMQGFLNEEAEPEMEHAVI